MEMRDCLIVISIFLSVFSAPSFLWSAGSAQENGFPRQETLLNSGQLGRAMEMHLQENSMYLWSQNVHTSPTTQTQALGFLSISKAPKPPTRKAQKKNACVFCTRAMERELKGQFSVGSKLLISKKTSSQRGTQGCQGCVGCPGVKRPSKC